MPRYSIQRPPWSQLMPCVLRVLLLFLLLEWHSFFCSSSFFFELGASSRVCDVLSAF